MTNLANKRIFVVEDNLENRYITRLALSQTGVHLGFDIWGRHLLDKLHKFAPIDLIVLDLMFPLGISGYDIIDEIRLDPAFAHVSVIAVSAADTSTAIRKCREKGFDGFIAKPIDPDLFPEQIARVLAGEAIWYDGTYVGGQ